MTKTKFIPTRLLAWQQGNQAPNDHFCSFVNIPQIYLELQSCALSFVAILLLLYVFHSFSISLQECWVQRQKRRVAREPTSLHDCQNDSLLTSVKFFKGKLPNDLLIGPNSKDVNETAEPDVD